MKWITASDITNWANKDQRGCQSKLPELVRRLILAHTGGNHDELDFPSGDSVALHGWDGRLDTPINFLPYFPSGASGWEMGAGKSVSKKGNEDFKKRVEDPRGMNPSETTFVFVTPHPFSNRDIWAAEKRALSKWKDVRVINASILEQWIDLTPSVALWLAPQLNKGISQNMRDLEYIWNEWSAGAEPTITPQLVVAGRTKEMEDIQNWLRQAPSILSVQADDPKEAQAFLYASIALLPILEKERALSRCVVVDNLADMRNLIDGFPHSKLIIVATSDCEVTANKAKANGHHVYITRNASSVNESLFRLSRPRRESIEKLLHEGGLSKAEADRIARDCGRSIPILRRHLLLRSGALESPKWANGNASKILLPVLFANAWNEDKKSDRQLIEVLTGKDYKAFMEELTPFLSADDTPVRKVGNIWMIKSPLDAWYLLAPHLSQDQLQLFKKALLAVLTKTDPKYELDSDKRWMASVYGKENPYSDWLRTGLVESLVLLAVFGDKSPAKASTQLFADHIVEEVFFNADTWEAWASLKDTTPLLAEASPEKFMQAVEKKISSSPKLFEELMRDDSGIFGECRHSGLLWALEGLSWSRDYITQAVIVLTELSNIDCGNRWANRPLNSLSNIFLPGLPQTHVKPAERIEVLKQLATKSPKIMWQFVASYYNGGSVAESYRLRWRDTGGYRRGLEKETSDEYKEYMQGLLPIMERLACNRANVISSLDIFVRLPAPVRKKLLSTIAAIDPSELSSEETSLLLKEIREKLNWIKSYGKENFGDDVLPLERILTKFAPSDVIERVGWVVNTPWPSLPQADPEDYDDKEKLIKAEQKKAAREMLDEASMDSILEFAGKVQYPGTFGYSLGAAANAKEDGKVLESLIKHSSHIPYLIIGYAKGRIDLLGSEWVDKQVEGLRKNGSYTPEACALIHMGLPESSEIWQKVEKQGKQVEIAYWKIASGYSRSNKDKDAQIAVEKLLNVKRPIAALKIAGDPKADVPSKLLQRLIQELLDTKDSNLSSDSMSTFYLGKIFKQLYEKNELSIEEMVRLEWPFALIFDDIKRYISVPMAIHRSLQNDPQFFAQLVSFMYKRDDHLKDASDEGLDEKIKENRSRAARAVLDSWYLMPGAKDDGSIDEEKFNKWIDAVRNRCEETKHIVGGDIQIGYLLAHAHNDPDDGKWPHLAVRNLIERLNNKTINDHIQTEIFNSRGVVSRGLGDGGSQERQLAEKYKGMSDELKVRWPRTASILHSLAEWYKGEARKADIDSELRDLQWD